MKITNTLDIETDQWSDPGDYPNSLAGYPLPDGPLQVVDIIGSVVMEDYAPLVDEDEPQLVTGFYSGEDLDENHAGVFGELYKCVPHGVWVERWGVALDKDGKLEFTVIKFDADDWSPE